MFLTKRKLLFLVLGVIIPLLFITILIEAFYCLSSDICILRVGSSFPFLARLTGVRETEREFKKNNFKLDKNLNMVTISGEIIKIAGEKLTIRFLDNSEKILTVKEGSEFLVCQNPCGYYDDFNYPRDNLEDFLSPNDYVVRAYFSSSMIFSEIESIGGFEGFVPIIVIRGYEEPDES